MASTNDTTEIQSRDGPARSPLASEDVSTDRKNADGQPAVAATCKNLEDLGVKMTGTLTRVNAATKAFTSDRGNYERKLREGRNALRNKPEYEPDLPPALVATRIREIKEGMKAVHFADFETFIDLIDKEPRLSALHVDQAEDVLKAILNAYSDLVFAVNVLARATNEDRIELGWNRIVAHDRQERDESGKGSLDRQSNLAMLAALFNNVKN